MRILITGASGLLGINLALEAAKQHTVFGQINNNEIHTQTISVLKADLLEPGMVERIFEETRPEWVIHCAALANLDLCEKNPNLARELNSEVPRKLAKLCRCGGARLLHVSTDAVFDGTTGNYSEQDKPNPLSIYAKTKLSAEFAVEEENPEAIIARVNLFGWSISGHRSLAEFFYNNLQEGNPVMGFKDVYFCPILVNDIAHIFIKMLNHKLRGIYHVVSSDVMSKYEFGVNIASRFGFDQRLITPISVREADLKAVRSPNLTLCIDKLVNDLGESTPKISTGIHRLFTLYQQGYPQIIRQLAGGS